MSARTRLLLSMCLVLLDLAAVFAIREYGPDPECVHAGVWEQPFWCRHILAIQLTMVASAVALAPLVARVATGAFLADARACHPLLLIVGNLLAFTAALALPDRLVLCRGETPCNLIEQTLSDLPMACCIFAGSVVATYAAPAFRALRAKWTQSA